MYALCVPKSGSIQMHTTLAKQNAGNVFFVVDDDGDVVVAAV